VELVAHVDLPRDALQELRQRLVDGVQRHGPGDLGVNVDVDARVAREREEQLLEPHVVDHDAVGFGARRRLGRRQQRSEAHRRRDRPRRRRLFGFQVLVRGHRRHVTAGAEQRREQRDRSRFSQLHWCELSRGGE
jgi:hypothetical protein